MTTINEHPYNTLTPDRVLDAVESVGYLSDARIFPLNSYENRVYQVGIEAGQPLIAKFYRPDRWSREQILEEHQFTQALKDAHIPVVAPVADSNGETLHQHQGFMFALFERRGGHAPELDNLDNLYVLGRTLGRIHLLGATQTFNHRPELDVVSFGHSSRELLLNGQWLPGTYASDYQHLSEEILGLIEQRFAQFPQMRKIRLHGDCHPGNILWRDDAPHFVDFDDCRMGPAVQDLWMLLAGQPAEQKAQLADILEGYAQFANFEPAEAALIEALRALRMIHYAAWLARRWHDPAFPRAFPWFGEPRYWERHVAELEEQLMALEQS